MKRKFIFFTVLLLMILTSGYSALADVGVGDEYVFFDLCEHDGNSELPYGKGVNGNCYYPYGENTEYVFPEIYTWSAANITEADDGALLRATKTGTTISVTVDRIPAMYKQIVSKDYKYLVMRVKTSDAAEGTVTFSSLGSNHKRNYSVSFSGEWQIITLDLSGVDGWTSKQSDGSYKPMTTGPWDNGHFSADGFAITFSPFDDSKRNEVLIDYLAYSRVPELFVKTGRLEKRTAYIEGDTDGLFHPNDRLTRRDAAIITARLIGFSDGDSEGLVCRFSDIGENDYGYESIVYLDSLGVLSRTDGKFRPDDDITVSELCAMIVNSGLCLSESLDGAVYNDTAESESITRAEACAVINSLTGRAADIDDTYSEFPDISASHPLFGDLLAASRSSDMRIARDGTSINISTYHEPNYAKTAEALQQIDKKAQELYGKIHNSKTEIVASGKCYYVSPTGNDSNSGTSPDSPWRTLGKVNAVGFTAGSTVYFERGGLWRGSVRLLPNVTYTAYGEGEKPTLVGSPYDGADPSLWTLVEGTSNIWRFKYNMLDCGSVVFNGGEFHSDKEIPSYNGTAYLHRNSTRVFDFKTDIARDLGIFCDNKRNMTVECPLYLRCDKGNPGELFDSIEFMPRQNIISVVANMNATVDNIRFMYGGAHAIGAGTLSGFTVTNCEFLWIGGSIQNYTPGGGIMPVRYGNAVESYGAASNYTVENCYFHQIYDAGITHQMSGGTQANGIQKNIRYANNLIEYCSYSVEYFLGDGESGTPTRYMENVIIEDNIMRYAGFGFGNQRKDRICMSHIKSGNHRNAVSGDFIIRNNIFDRSREMLIYIGSNEKEHLPVLVGNTYIQYLTERSTPYSTLGKYGAHPARLMLFEKNAEILISETLDPGATVLTAKRDSLYDLPEY